MRQSSFVARQPHLLVNRSVADCDAPRPISADDSSAEADRELLFGTAMNSLSLSLSLSFSVAVAIAILLALVFFSAPRARSSYKLTFSLRRPSR